MKILCLLFILITMPLLSQEAKITISVVDENNQPVLSFRVDVMDTSYKSLKIDTINSNDGVYTFTTSKIFKNIQLKFSGSGFAERLRIPVSDTNFTLKVYTNTGSISGSVVDTNGKPVVGAVVRVTGTRLGAFVKPDGKFKVDYIREGKYKIKITAVGYRTNETDVIIKKCDTNYIKIILEDSPIIHSDPEWIRGINHWLIGTIRTYDAWSNPSFFLK